MKITVTVDLDDFYSDDDSEAFSTSIKRAIREDAVRQVLADWKTKIAKEFNDAVTAEVTNQKDLLIANELRRLAVEAKVKKRYNSSEMISITDWIIDEFERTQLSNTQLQSLLSGLLKDSSEKIVKEFRARYDLMFATQIVSKLRDNGMLKDDVAKLLLDQDSGAAGSQEAVGRAATPR